MAEFASKGVAGAGLGLGIAGTALGVLSGGLGNILGNIGSKQCNHGDDIAFASSMASLISSMASIASVGHNEGGDRIPVNRYEAAQSARIAELETEVKLRDANTFTMSEIGKLRDYVDSKFATVHEELCQQRVYNATNIATVNCLSGQVAQLMSLTKVVIPNTSICPGWGNVTVAPATTTA